ncbi:MAG: sugar ABC transporter permease [Rhizobiaceae bacterium]|nr:sugar ABC transporter permease [Rhizobiaceae bacterium]
MAVEAQPPARAHGARAGKAFKSGSAPRRRQAIGIALTLPALVTLAVTMLYPMAWTLWLSFNTRVTALQGTPDFVGFDNYLRIAASSGFTTALLQTVGIVLASFVLEAVLALIVALALFRALRGSRIFQAIVALPLMVAPVVGALAWRFIFADGYGMIDTVAQHLGGEGPLWFADVWLARTSVVVANLWLALPFDILVLLAGLSSLPTEPLEAARVDGASPAQILRRIILPLLKPVISIIFVIRMADAFRIFDVVYVLTASGPANRTDVLSTYIYRQMFSAFDFPGGAAASIMLVIITSLASLLVVVALRDRWQSEA